jgi:ribosomal protein S18 acetylase RimI-like enzyme
MLGGRLRARRLTPADRDAALDHLLLAPDENLVLIDQLERLAERPGPAEPPPQLHGAWDEGRLAGMAALRPGITLSHAIDDRALGALRPALLRLPSGLIKSERRAVDALWPAFVADGREPLIDRLELAYRLARTEPLPDPPSEPVARGGRAGDGTGRVRRAHAGDLDALVYAARASLREEQRPDPAVRDPIGFARWVEGRMGRARVVEADGRVVFVAYADVQSRHGWLVQGVYTWPEHRRRGHARLGMRALVREAFAAGASHVQLAVVAGNERAAGLYRKLGFEPFAELRTILFH